MTGRSAPALFLIAALLAGGAGGQETPPEPPEAMEPEGIEAVSPGEELEEAPAAEGVEEPAAPLPERITFEIPFPIEKGGGTARGSAGTVQYLSRDFVVATGAVELAYQDLKFQGERVEVDLQTKKVIAAGTVIVDQGPSRLTGETLDFDLETKTGVLTEAHAYVDPDVYFSGAEIAKVGDNLYTIKHGMMTSCPGDSPAWSFRLGTARMKVDGYARVSNLRMRAKKLPFMYMPYLLFPTNQDRKSGLLFPNFGYSQTRGNLIGLAYYQTLGDSYDATLFFDKYADDFVGVGTEFRYRPTHGTGGQVEAYAIQDPLDEWRWKALMNHSSDDLPHGVRGVLRVVEFSDFDFFRDFERNFNDVSVRRINSFGFLSGNWGSHSVNLLLDQKTTFIRRGVEVVQRQIPELEYKLRARQLGRLPLYLSIDSAAHYFSSKRTESFASEYGRLDLAPRLTVPLSYWPWLSASVTAGYRVTEYEDSLTPSGDEFSGESLTRTFPSGSAEIVGPSLSRIFDKQIGRFGKFKHVIEPRWSYLNIGTFDDQNLVPLFDEIDTLQPREIVGVSLVNRLLAKPADEESLEGTREILSFELGQAFSLKSTQPFQSSRDGTLTKTASPINARLRFNPGLKIYVESRATYNTLFKELDTASLTSGTRFERWALGLTWFARFNPELEGRTTTHQGRLGFGVDLIRNRLRLDSQLNYDFVLKFMQQQRHVVTISAQCFGLRFEYRNLRTLTIRDRDYRFALSLKNIGTFLDLNSGGREPL